MELQSNIWQFVAGIGLFLYAMKQLERALENFAGRKLRVFLQRHTNTALKSASIGTVSTAILQSSSLVALIVLAFAGASVISLQNALGVIFGANLGTTFTGWVVTTVGFKLDLDSASLPLVGLGGLLFTAFKGRVAEYGRMAVAVGFLLMGLSLMKESVGSLGQDFDISFFAGLVSWQFLLFGIVAAAIMQSSSAVMVLTLTALHANVVDLPAAAAVAIGADLGTTSTVLVGAIQGAAIKRRVALGHVMFNVTTAIIAFTLLVPLLQFVRSIGVEDPLLSLVAFHSLFNFIGLVIFLPVIRPFARFLGRQFVVALPKESAFVSETNPLVADAAIRAIAEETANIVGRVILHNLRVFSPPIPTPPGQLPVGDQEVERGARLSSDELYRKNKRLEGEILSFALAVQGAPMDPAESQRLNNLLSSVRHVVHSAKSLRDVRHNLEEFEVSPKPSVAEYANHFRGVMIEFYGEVFRLRSDTNMDATIRDYAELINRVQSWHDHLHRVVYADIKSGTLSDDEISSLLNVNREILNSNIALLTALQEYSLSASESAALEEMPSNT